MATSWPPVSIKGGFGRAGSFVRLVNVFLNTLLLGEGGLASLERLELSLPLFFVPRVRRGWT